MRIEQLWRDLEQSPTFPVFRRINETHPLDIYAGVDENRDPLLRLLTKHSALALGSYQSLSVQRFRREDATWSYTVALQDRKLTPLFALLCDDLIRATEPMAAALAGSQFFARLERWKALLANGALGLNEQEVRGLLAELCALTYLLAPRFGAETSVFGWAGPEAEEQDFRIGDRSFEIKAIAPGKTRVRIASLRQLDSLTYPLDLIVIPVAPASAGEGETLAGLIGAIRASLTQPSEASVAFESKLMLTGYSTTDEAATRPYIFGSPTRYEVKDAFPRLIPNEMPDGVVEATYTIDLTFCADFRRALPL